MKKILYWLVCDEGCAGPGPELGHVSGYIERNSVPVVRHRLNLHLGLAGWLMRYLRCSHCHDNGRLDVARHIQSDRYRDDRVCFLQRRYQRQQ